MKATLVAAAITLAASAAMADAVVTNGPDWVRITDKPCTLEVPPDWKQFNPLAAIGHIDGKDVQACWVMVQGTVALYYSDGDYGAVPAAAFRPAKDA